MDIRAMAEEAGFIAGQESTNTTAANRMWIGGDMKLATFANLVLEAAAKVAHDFPAAVDGRLPIEIASAIRAMKVKP